MSDYTQADIEAFNRRIEADVAYFEREAEELERIADANERRGGAGKDKEVPHLRDLAATFRRAAQAMRDKGYCERPVMENLVRTSREWHHWRRLLVDLWDALHAEGMDDRLYDRHGDLYERVMQTMESRPWLGAAPPPVREAT